MKFFGNRNLKPTTKQLEEYDDETALLVMPIEVHQHTVCRAPSFL